MKFAIHSLSNWYTEIVNDCHSIEEFINRHFGSVDPEEHGIKVTMHEEDEELTPPVPKTDEVEQAAPAQPTNPPVQTAPEDAEQAPTGINPDDAPAPTTPASTVTQNEEV